MRGAEERSFLAPPGRVCDWRLVVLHGAADDAGILASLPATPGEISNGLGLDAHAVRVVLDGLAAWDVVVPTDGRYALGPGAFGAAEADVLHHHARAIGQTTALLGERLGATVPDDGRSLARWLAALAVGARRSAPAVVDACLARLPGARSVLDVGGGHGEYALAFARRGLRAVVQDRPETVGLLESQGQLREAGVELFAGDFFETLPDQRFDLVFCAGVTHTYDQSRNVELIRRLTPLVADDGALAIHTFLRGRSPVVALFALQMLVVGNGGDTHAEDDYRRWLEEAGCSSVEVVDFEGGERSMVLAWR